MNRSEQLSEADRRGHELSHLPHVGWCTICCRARTIDDPHHAENKMKGDTTPVRVLLVVESSTGYLGATDVESDSSGFAAKLGMFRHRSETRRCVRFVFSSTVKIRFSIRFGNCNSLSAFAHVTRNPKLLSTSKLRGQKNLNS